MPPRYPAISLLHRANPSWIIPRLFSLLSFLRNLIVHTTIIVRIYCVALHYILLRASEAIDVILDRLEIQLTNQTLHTSSRLHA